MITKKRLAFTLVEGLLAVTIVGIVAALTLPALISKYQKDSFAALLKKNYNELEHNLVSVHSNRFYRRNLYDSVLCRKSKLVDDAGVKSLSSLSVSDTAGKFLRENYNISKDCQQDTTPCFASEYMDLQGNSQNFTCSEGYSVTLKSGSALCIIPADTAHDGDAASNIESKPNDTDVIVHLDVNGSAMPNIGGRDMFTFYIYKDYSVDDLEYGVEKSLTKREAAASTCESSAFGVGCLSKMILNNWKMDY